MSTATPTPTPTPKVPLPRLVLRVGFIGPRGSGGSDLGSALEPVFTALTQGLHNVVPGDNGANPEQQKWTASEFYDRGQKPLLRLITGLDASGDTAWTVLKKEKASQADQAAGVETELAAVLPFDLATSVPRVCNPVDRLQDCSYVFCVDGSDKSAELEDLALNAQREVLLRQCDLLIVAADVAKDQGWGETCLELLEKAQSLGVLGVFIDGNGLVRLFDAESNVLRGLWTQDDSTADHGKQVEEALREWVTRLTAGPLYALQKDAEDAGKSLEWLRDYFYDSVAPSVRHKGRWWFKLIKPLWTLWSRLDLKWFELIKPLWSWLEKRIRKNKPFDIEPQGDDPIHPFGKYRRRATELNYKYTDFYRSVFLMNYALAVVAVVLAILALGLLAIECDPKQLLAVVVVKLVVLALIWRNTKAANEGAWGKRAVEYRYLAECLRPMFYLPLVGGFRAPKVAQLAFASQTIRQSVVDWLFGALVRSAAPDKMNLEVKSPADSGKEKPRLPFLKTERGHEIDEKLLRVPLAPERNGPPHPSSGTAVPMSEVLTHVRDRWVLEQAIYHQRNAGTMRCLDSLLKKWAFYLSGAAIGVVFLDLIILILECWHVVPAIAVDFLKRFTLVLVGATAILPAIVAALNGIRAQAECGRLAGRSSVIQLLLTGKEKLQRYGPDQAEAEKEARKKYTGVYRSLSELADDYRSREAAPANEQEAWSRDALLAVEAIACQLLEETVEWTVLYAKEMPET